MTTLEDIKARVEKATPGPWWCVAHDNGVTVAGAGSEHIATINPYYKDDRDGGNADFIAHARTDIPFLLGEVGRLKTALRVNMLRHTPFSHADIDAILNGAPS